MVTPLHRNRNYNLLWISRALSEFGTQTSLIAFQLLTLAVTGSPAIAGLVAGVTAAARLVASLPAGAVADRLDRRRVMLYCEAAQTIALASLVAALWSEAATVYHIVAVAVVLGACLALFESAESAALLQVVAREQLSNAIAMNTARAYFGQLAGTAASGFLFGARRFLPFLVDAVMHAVAWGLLLFVRIPAPRQETRPPVNLLAEVSEGLKWVWRHRFVRVTALCSMTLNMLFHAFYIIVITVAFQRGDSPGEIGVMGAMLGVGGLLGAVAAPRLHQIITPALSVIGIFWVLALLMPVAVLLDDPFLTGLLLAALSFLTPTANTTVSTYQMLLTPDGLRGRLSGVMNLINGIAAALGPAAGGLVIAAVAEKQAVLGCSAAMAALALAATASPTLRGFTGAVGEPAEPATTDPRERIESEERM